MQLITAASRLARMRALLALALAFGLGATLPADVRACTCAMSEDLPADLVEAELAFVGTVAGRRPAPEVRLLGATPVLAATFVVERSSAATGEHLVVHAPHGADDGVCGITFGVGERWLLRIHRADGVLQTSACSAIGLVEDLTPDELAAVERLLPHRPPERSTDETSPSSWAALLAPVVVAAGTAALAVVLLATGRRRHRGSG